MGPQQLNQLTNATCLRRSVEARMQPGDWQCKWCVGLLTDTLDCRGYCLCAQGRWHSAPCVSWKERQAAVMQAEDLGSWEMQWDYFMSSGEGHPHRLCVIRFFFLEFSCCLCKPIFYFLILRQEFENVHWWIWGSLKYLQCGHEDLSGDCQNPL